MQVHHSFHDYFDDGEIKRSTFHQGKFEPSRSFASSWDAFSDMQRLPLSNPSGTLTCIRTPRPNLLSLYFVNREHINVD